MHSFPTLRVRGPHFLIALVLTLGGTVAMAADQEEPPTSPRESAERIPLFTADPRPGPMGPDKPLHLRSEHDADRGLEVDHGASVTRNGVADMPDAPPVRRIDLHF